jgi:hypothetical protein
MQQQVDYPYTVGFHQNEIIINMCALALFHSRKVADVAGHEESRNAKLSERARQYMKIAENLIMRCQEALDDRDLNDLESSQKP